ncbi:predicted protein [Histoplasma mississippiense (nom. inval.)]|uniref:predicted protein n=1 Tax=Ajellomyces capsulatus (strain NAm1 / WU24) TaxID=2059318 RepID=UPI000157BAFA|nr:predicted protein [Histoplasma mississippiense (nom. inval.)]EDN05579.1 predicted protein [Histoplasma mississippiense (nom. inval.)]
MFVISEKVLMKEVKCKSMINSILWHVLIRELVTDFTSSLSPCFLTELLGHCVNPTDYQHCAVGEAHDSDYKFSLKMLLHCSSQI